MSILSIIQHVCGRTNVPVPATVLGSTDAKIVQMLRLLEEEGNDLAQRGDWTALTWEALHTTLAAQAQGFMETIAPRGFRHIKNGTFWDRTNRLPIMGPLNDQEWQAAKAMNSATTRYRFRLRTLGTLYVIPAPPAGLSWAFEYVSKYWLVGADLTTFKQYATLDTDTSLLPEELLIMGLRWRWLKEKGLEYAEAFRTYENQVLDALGRDGGKTVLSMDGDRREAMPGVFVPTSSWNLP